MNIEELSLEHNCITKIENISKLTKLKRLTLGHNYLSSLDGCGLDKLTQLQYISVESNRLKSLLGLQRNTALIEVYAGNNLIENVREVFYLKVSVLNEFNSLICGNFKNLVSFQRNTELTEVYSQSNLLENIREVFYLKVSVVLLKFLYTGNY